MYQKTNKRNKWNGILSIFLMIALFLVGCSATNQSENTINSTTKLAMQTEVLVSQQKKQIVSGTISEKMAPNESLFFLLRGGNVIIKKNNEIVFQDTKENRGTEKILYSAWWCEVKYPAYNVGDTITIEVQGKNAKLIVNDILKTLYKGNAIDLLRFELSKHAIQIVISIIIIMIAAAYMITFLTLHGLRTELSKRYIACAILLLSGGLCTLIDYNYISLFLPYIHAVNIVDFLTQCMVVICLILYIVFFFQKKQDHDVAMLVLSGTVLSLTVVTEILHYYIASYFWIIVFQGGLLFFAVVQFVILLNDAKETFRLAEEMEMKMNEERIAIMLSQIQPHFLYNALNTIQYLCEVNPQQAAETIESFAGYLRGNMDSLSYKTPIPFVRELQHLKQYLMIEKQRFEDVEVEYDFKTVDFNIPALTVQPLVENAIKYGVSRKEGGGTVTVSTWEDESNFYVKIEDDGVGFNPLEVQYDGRSHIGIQNTSDRLMSMSHGTIKIDSKQNQGTSVTLTLPKEKEEL